MKITLFILSVLLVSGCTTGNYQNFNGGVGYQSTQLKPNEFSVSYTGTSSTNIKKVNDFTLLRSAELTLEHGYKYFVISEAKNNRNELGVLTNLNAPDVVGYGNRPESSGSWSTASKVKAKSEMYIFMYDEKPDAIVYDAAIISKAIRDEYGIK